jgi:hypothetical protein
MENKEIKNERNPESNSFLLDIQMHNSIEPEIASSLAKDIAKYVSDREKVESCLISYMNHKKGEVSFVICNNEIRRMIDFSWDDDRITEGSILYTDGEHFPLNKKDISRINKEIYSIPGSFIESAMDTVTLNFIDHLIK